MADAYLLESGGTDNYALEDGTGNYLLDAPVLVLHLDASAITGQSDGVEIASWPDLSGFANDASQTGTARPTYETAEIGGLPIVRFDGVEDWMSVAHHSSLNLDNWTIFVVAKANAVHVGQGALLEKWTTGGPYPIALREVTAILLTAIYDGTNNPSSDATGSQGVPYLVTARRSSGDDDIRIWLDGTEGGNSPNVDDTTATTLNTDPLAIGARGGGVGLFFNGDIGEVQIWNGAMTTAEREAVEDALLLKWLTGVSIQPPTIAAPVTFGAFTVEGIAELELPDPIEVIASLPQPGIQIQPAVQKARPDADQSIGTWTTDSGGTTNLWDSLNETSASDADYVKSATTPTNNEVIFTLANIGDPESSTGHLVRFRYRKT